MIESPDSIDPKSSFSVQSNVPSLEFDHSRYNDELASLDLTDQQRLELLSVLWSIMQNLVELSYSVADLDICGSIFGSSTEAIQPSEDGIGLPHD